MWWNIRTIALRPVSFDFHASGQGVHSGRGLIADGTELVNDIDLADLSDGSCQVVVCSACGVPGCAIGNWVVMRRFGDSLVWLPDFGRLARDEGERSDAQPPAYFDSRGAPMFSGSALTMLQGVVPDLRLGDLPVLSEWEAVQLLQWQAPGGVLGTATNAPRLVRDLVLAVNPGDRAARCAELEALLAAASRDAAAMTPPAGSSVIDFYLDLPGHRGWQPVVETPHGPLTWNIAGGAGMPGPS